MNALHRCNEKCYMGLMEQNPHMTLSEWMDAKERTLQQVADLVGTTKMTVARWKAHAAVPRREAMLKIVDMTGGAVRPESFYPSDMGGDAPAATPCPRKITVNSNNDPAAPPSAGADAA